MGDGRCCHYCRKYTCVCEDKTIQVGDKVRRINSDYGFNGTVVSVFQKVRGLVRYFVEDDRGVLFIWRRDNMEKIE